jgi:hypothetical protein
LYSQVAAEYHFRTAHIQFSYSTSVDQADSLVVLLEDRNALYLFCSQLAGIEQRSMN